MTAGLPGRPRRAAGGDRGSVSLWVVVFAFTTFALLILVVDGGQVMNAKSRAADVGEQAARAAADDLDVAALRSGGPLQLAGGACDTQAGPAANLVGAYAKGIPGATASLLACQPVTTLVDGQRTLSVRVTVRLSATPAIPVGVFSAINATATETAFVACGNADAQEAC